MKFDVQCPYCGKLVECEENTALAEDGDVLRSLVESCPHCAEPFVTEIAVTLRIFTRKVEQGREVKR